MDAHGVETTLLEPSSIGTKCKIIIHKIPSIDHAVPSNGNRINLPQRISGNIESTQAFDTQHPFVPICGKEIDGVPFYVNRQRTEALNCINTEKNAALFAESTNSPQIVFESAVALNGTDGDNARADIGLSNQIIEKDAPIPRFHHARFHAQAF